MASDQRRIAADARRIGDRSTQESVADVRKLLKKNFDRGVEVGREQERRENASTNARSLLLNFGAEILDALGAHGSKIPNSRRANGAYKEAAAILRDAAREGEPPAESERSENGRSASKGKTSKAKK